MAVKRRAHVRTLVWKNFLLMRKHPWKLAFEILFPVLLLYLIGSLKDQAANIDVPAGWSDDMDAVFSPRPITAPTFPLFDRVENPRDAKFYVTEATFSGLLRRMASRSYTEGRKMHELSRDDAYACYTKLVRHGDVSLDASSAHAVPVECRGKVSPYKIALVPDTAFTRAYFAPAIAAWYPRVPLSSNSSEKASLPSWRDSIAFFSNETALEAYVSGPSYGLDASFPKVYAAIVFKDPPATQAIGTATSLSYSIRLSASLTSGPKTSTLVVDPHQKAMIPATYKSYTKSGFLALQTLVTRFLTCLPSWDRRGPGGCTNAASVAAPNATLDARFLVQVQHDADLLDAVSSDLLSSLPPITQALLLRPLRQAPQPYFGSAVFAFPIAAYTASPFYTLIAPFMPFAFAASYVNIVSGLIVALVSEKELKARELMKILGVRDVSIFAGWFVTYGLLFFVLAALQTIPSSLHVFSHASPGLIFAFFFLSGLAVVAFGSLLSAFFSKAKTGAYVGVLAFFMLFLIADALANASENAKTAACVAAPAAMSLGLSILVQAEATSNGITWSTMDHAFGGISFQTVLVFLALDTVLYTLLGMYVEKVLPKEYGVPEHWTFPLQWCFAKRDLRSSEAERLLADASPISDVVEDVSLDLQQQADDGDALEIRQLRKSFFPASDGDTTEKVAVAGMNLTLYKNQITCLLGHNGAGKTTLVSMLTGMLPPTSGDATMLRGLSLRRDMQAIRNSIGMCPQHDVLYDDLTVLEHMTFYAAIKGCAPEDVNAKLVAVGLDERRHTSAKALSGGMKRKLSLAIAFLGDSKIVFLDEPTSGMDPYSRRLSWDIMLSHRLHRIIVLTTHSMDEADILGDRIAIMANGELQCVGSSLFLKTKYGAGYTLSLVTTNIDAVVAAVSRHVAHAKVLASVGAEVSIQLPLESSASFPSLFALLDTDASSLGLSSYGISVTTLEEVFLKVSETTHVDVGPKPRLATASYEAPPVAASLFRSHFAALWRKRYLVAKRDRKAVLFAVVWPVLYIAIGIALLQSNALVQNDPSLSLTSSLRADTSAPFSCTGDDNEMCKRVLSAQTFFSGALPSYLASVVAPVYPNPHLSVFGVAYDNISVDDTSGFCLRTAEIALKTSLQAVQFGGYVAYGDASRHIWLQHAYQALVRYFAGNATLNVSVANHPLPLTAESKTAFTTALSFSATTFFVVAIAYFSASIVPHLVSEKHASRNAKHQQLLAGASVPAFWLSNLAWDLLLYFFPCAFALYAIWSSDLSPFTGLDCPTCATSAFPAVVCLFVFVGAACIGFSYCLSFFCHDPANAQSYIISCNIYLGIYLSLASLVLSSLATTHELNACLLGVGTCICLSPLFCLSHGLNSLSLSVLRPSHQSAFDWDVAGADVVYLAIEAVLYPLLAIGIDYLLCFPSIARRLFRDPVVEAETPFPVDHDVEVEAARVQAGPEHDVVSMSSLRKVYKDGKVGLATLSLGLPRGECFGFLGTNGAGKSTTMKILTGEIGASSGSAQLQGLDIVSQQLAIRRYIGYCPQFDALLDLLTVREHLELFATLKGVSSTHTRHAVDAKIEQLGLTPFEHCLAKTLSGGTKRKLSVAIALIGAPPVLFLDEPSTGMDPGTRRFLWELISDVSTRSKTATVFLTTHSMEECEALCTRVGIMVDGRLRCLGSIQHLKSRFGDGLLLHLKLTPVTARDVDAMLATHPAFPAQSLSRSELLQLCMVLGRPDRMHGISPDHATGYALADTLERGLRVRPSEVGAWWLREDRFEACYARLSTALGAVNVSLVERHLDVCRVKVQATDLGHVFRLVESMKDVVQEYTVSQTTLEQIFNAFASRGSHVVQ
ncbi:hypothetical protein SPRG_05291 [Saprolegnia parasitica CBS 223.65]|uniref:ABC transporter domain-containing protein n=1 Tax=Saprolegnia parasitica (strain CBS 223.65) TaxID=695850 RepID=A0A067CLL2_SAPPC|nr:hypothetical protein SPRG_05291 [Saprolegnia parasitica CBS 223.65]KDO30100.1 hypothetical protein SPRG_05291 [Saprolegnia parasitica CBS 223.65]|eukprot:XP_012199281.1 hypothetical protein SPRG_05291 [Saprolegnia parasitica CBS 223.65]